MTDNETAQSKTVNPAVDALDRWDDEGGAPATDASTTLLERGAALTDDERQVLRNLGAAVVMRWRDLATDVQRNLYNSALADGKADLVADLPERIARLLHERKGKE